ncbi:MAG: hypothetical protein KAQ94_06080 [Arcobacteraceae bacterium]|nr:hypothetical protein [Arcobacteraceae bacterium]
MEKNNYSIEDCQIKATIVGGEIIIFDYKLMRYDSADDIHWYKGQALSKIEILDPDGKPQTKYKVFG